MSFRGAVRRLRIERRGELRQRGITPNRVTRVYRVDLDKLTVPDWAARRAVKGLSGSRKHVWLRRWDAKRLEECEAQIGGLALLTETEYRKCPVCDRVLIGEDAEMRRRLNESCMTGTQLPCGGDCLARSRSCEHHDDPVAASRHGGAAQSAGATAA